MRACTRAKGHVREVMKTRRDDDHEDQKWAHVDRAPTRGLRCAQVTSNGAPQKATRGRPLSGDPAVSEPAERDLMKWSVQKTKSLTRENRTISIGSCAGVGWCADLRSAPSVELGADNVEKVG